MSTAPALATGDDRSRLESTPRRVRSHDDSADAPPRPGAGITRSVGTLSQGTLAALRRLPAAARVCAVIALFNACVWSLVTPPFQGKDEVDHFAYVAQLAETSALPASPSSGNRILRGRRCCCADCTTTKCASSPAAPAIGSDR